MSQPGFLSLAVSRPVVVRSLKVAMVVGTILALINHGEKIFTLTLSSKEALKIILCYFVPYCVSTWSAAGALKAAADAQKQ